MGRIASWLFVLSVLRLPYAVLARSLVRREIDGTTLESELHRSRFCENPFEHVFVLNVASSQGQNRRDHIKDEFKKAGIHDYVLWHAIEESTLDEDSADQDVDAVMLQHPGVNKSSFLLHSSHHDRAVALGHRNLHEHMVAEQMKCALVFEDDISLAANFTNRLAEARNSSAWQSASSIGMLLLDYIEPEPQKEGARLEKALTVSTSDEPLTPLEIPYGSLFDDDVATALKKQHDREHRKAAMKKQPPLESMQLSPCQSGSTLSRGARSSAYILSLEGAQALSEANRPLVFRADAMFAVLQNDVLSKRSSGQQFENFCLTPKLAWQAPSL